MRMTSVGRKAPSQAQRMLIRFFSSLRKRLTFKVAVSDGAHELTFIGESYADVLRPMTLKIKEEGTFAWIEREVRAGDRFLDIGANIGIYTLSAAARVGAEGKVYAVEPHKINSLTLMKNIAASGFVDRVDVLPFGLSDRPQVVRFNYLSLLSASSGSQLGTTQVEGHGDHFRPVATELLPAFSVDALIADKVIEPPTLVKIDVDGLELPILRGMEGLLRAAQRPRAIQVEINLGQRVEIDAFMTAAGYGVDGRHTTMASEQLRAAGKSVEDVAHNAIYVPARVLRDGAEPQSVSA